MSQNKERSEKICLNCGENLQNRFCPVCGQENVEPKESVWGMVSHFAYDITHFDGKFFSTVKYLLTKPGFLSLEHTKGRRIRYLHPIRLYVFTSAFFFIIFFSIFNVNNILINSGNKLEKELEEKKEALASVQKQLPEERDSVMRAAMERASVNLNKGISAVEAALANKKKSDSVRFADKWNDLDSLSDEMPDIKELSEAIDTVKKIQKNRKKVKNRGGAASVSNDEKDGKNFISIGKTNVKFLSEQAYEEVQKELPEGKRDNWLERGLSYKTIKINKKVNKDEQGTWTLLLNSFLHTFPQVLFVSLPLFALLLKLLYIRRKKYYYVDHALFSIHLYCGTFIILLVIFTVSWLSRFPYMGWLDIVLALLFAAIFFYQYKAMRRFYAQGRIKTVLKFLALNFLSFLVLLIISVVFFIVSIWRFK